MLFKGTLRIISSDPSCTQYSVQRHVCVNLSIAGISSVHCAVLILWYTQRKLKIAFDYKLGLHTLISVTSCISDIVFFAWRLLENTLTVPLKINYLFVCLRMVFELCSVAYLIL